MTTKSALDGLLKVANVLEFGHLVVIDVVIMFKQGKVSLERLMLYGKLSDDGLELISDQ